MHYNIKIDKSKTNDLEYLKKQCNYAYNATHDDTHIVNQKDFIINFMIINATCANHNNTDECFVNFKSPTCNINVRYHIQ